METNKLKAFLGPFISPYVQIKEGFSVLISLLFLGLKPLKMTKCDNPINLLQCNRALTSPSTFSDQGSGADSDEYRYID